MPTLKSFRRKIFAFKFKFSGNLNIRKRSWGNSFIEFKEFLDSIMCISETISKWLQAIYSKYKQN